MSEGIAYDVGDRVRFATGRAVWTVEDVGGPNLERVLCRSAGGKSRWVDVARIRPADATDPEPSADTGPRVEFDEHGRCTVNGRRVRGADLVHSTVVEWEVPMGTGSWSDPSAVLVAVQHDKQQRAWAILSLAGGHVQDRESWDLPETIAHGEWSPDTDAPGDFEHEESEPTSAWVARFQRPSTRVALGKRAAIELAAELVRLSAYLED